MSDTPESLAAEVHALRERVFTDEEMDAVHNCVRHSLKCREALERSVISAPGWVCICGCTDAIRIILSKRRENG